MQHDATATDPGECFTPIPDSIATERRVCTEDLNGNGAVEVGDVLLVLAEFGCEADCTTDLTGDGFVAVDDVLILLSAFGTSCQ